MSGSKVCPYLQQCSSWGVDAEEMNKYTDVVFQEDEEVI